MKLRILLYFSECDWLKSGGDAGSIETTSNGTDATSKSVLKSGGDAGSIETPCGFKQLSGPTLQLKSGGDAGSIETFLVKWVLPFKSSPLKSGGDAGSIETERKPT